jgi:patatin-like phospholipase/acyl hydrolase
MPFQILCLSGGGFFGLYTISVLAGLEEQIKAPIASRFDLLAGTSVGGIIALGLANEVPASKIQSAFEANGAHIFSDRAAPVTWPAMMREFSRSLWKPKYSDFALRTTITDIVGADLLVGDLKHPCIVPAVNLTKGAPQVFKTDHHPNFKRDFRHKVVDVALATSAAPTYFPVAAIGDQLFADGGMYANSPDLLALHEAEHFFAVPLSEIWVLSIGTTTTRFSFSHTSGTNLGLLAWTSGQRLVRAMLSSQQLAVDSMVTHKLGTRYLRLDHHQSREQEQHLALDVATAAAQKTMRGLAEATTREAINNPVLQAMLGRTAPAATFYHRDRARHESAARK